MATRWTCPRCESAVLGPERPRHDNTCRYCLPCSEKDGHLIERKPLALERERRERAEKQRERSTRTKERARQQEAERYTVGGLDLREMVAEAYDLPVAREWRARRKLPTHPPSLRVRRATTWFRQSGLAIPWEHAIRVTVYVGLSWTGSAWDGPAKEPAAPIDTLLHEVAHILVSRDRQNRWHGLKFRECLAALRREYAAKHSDQVLLGDGHDEGDLNDEPTEDCGKAASREPS